jgi:SpoVK/Ycf46/Vps4 family AAA+-type ATPase
LKKRKQDPKKFDLDRLAASAEGYSGAEIEQAIVAAMHNAFAQRAELSTDLVNEALQHSPPLSGDDGGKSRRATTLVGRSLCFLRIDCFPWQRVFNPCSMG